MKTGNSGMIFVEFVLHDKAIKFRQKLTKAMEDLNYFVSNITKLWNFHLRRENAYKQVMVIENLGTFRRICSQGYSSSLLFKREIQWVYDEVKCALIDGDIQNFMKPNNTPKFNFPNEYKPSIARMLQDQEYRAINLYKRLLSQKNVTQEAKIIFTDHLEKLYDISLNLNKQLTKSSPRFLAVPPELQLI